MSEKHLYQSVTTPDTNAGTNAGRHPSHAPADTNAGWHPAHAPADTSRMGHQAVPPSYSAGAQPLGAQPQPQSYGTQPMKVTPGHQATPGRQVSALICPVTGGRHQETSRPGAIGLIIGILFCPIGCIAVCFDQKRTCRQCNAVIEEAWGGC